MSRYVSSQRGHMQAAQTSETASSTDPRAARRVGFASTQRTQPGHSARLALLALGLWLPVLGHANPLPQPAPVPTLPAQAEPVPAGPPGAAVAPAQPPVDSAGQTAPAIQAAAPLAPPAGLPPAGPPPSPSPFYASLDRGLGATTADGSFSAEAHIFAQLRLDEVISDRVNTPEFRIVMARPSLRGTLFRSWIQYFVQAELAGKNAALLDAELTVLPSPAIGLKVGQFLTPFSREFLVPPFRLLFPDFSPSNVFFRDSRDIGAMVFGLPWAGRFEYYAGVFNGNGINQALGGARIMGIARVATNLFGKHIYTETPELDDAQTQLSLGLNATYGRHDLPLPTAAAAGTQPEVAPYATLGIDASFHAGPCSTQGEGYLRWQQLSGDDTSWSAGGYLQGSCFVYRRSLQLAARSDVIDANVQTHAGMKLQGEGMLVYYVRGNHLKIQLRYAYGNTRGDEPATQASATHTLTAQTQLQL